MKKLFLITTLFVSLCSFSQTIGTVKTEEYKADFEKKQSINDVANYIDTIQLMLLEIIPEILYYQFKY